MYNCLRENQQFVNLKRDKTENPVEAKASLQNAMSNVGFNAYHRTFSRASFSNRPYLLFQIRFIRNEQVVSSLFYVNLYVCLGCGRNHN